MRAALVVPRISADAAANVARMVDRVDRAAEVGADLVVFPEAATTGFVNNDDPGHDLHLGEPVPGPATDILGVVARRRGIWIAFGLFERVDDALYDTVVIDRQGRHKFRPCAVRPIP